MTIKLNVNKEAAVNQNEVGRPLPNHRARLVKKNTNIIKGQIDRLASDFHTSRSHFHILFLVSTQIQLCKLG